MARVVVRGDRRMGEADPAAVWVLVADPERVGDWAPVKFVGWLGTTVPAVGQSFYVSRRTDADPTNAMRLEITEWEAGTRFRCSVTRPRQRGSEHVDVQLMSEVDEGEPVARLRMTYSGEHPRWRVPFASRSARRFIRDALDGVQRIVG